MLPYFLLFATAVVFTTGPKMAALQRFIEDSRGSVGSRFVDVAIYDHILGDDFCLAKEVATAERAGTLVGLVSTSGDSDERWRSMLISLMRSISSI
jgi:hypothetical protein